MQQIAYRQCTRCVMDTSDPQITFDSAGRCNNCTNFLRSFPPALLEDRESEKPLEQLFEKVRIAGQGKEYDSILGVSGGVDSSYAAHLSKQFGLRPLAVHMDNGWDSEESVRNVKRLMSVLDIDYQSYVLDWDEFRQIQLAFLRASVPEAETPTDVAIPVALHSYAAEHGVKYILSAGNYATEGLLPKSWHYNSKDLTYFRHILKKFGGGSAKTFRTFDLKQEAYYKLLKGIRFIYPLNYSRASQKEMTDVLIERYQYRPFGQKHFESIYTRFIHSYYLYVKFGIDYRRATLSSEICTGVTTRENALKMLETKPYCEEQIALDKPYIAKKLEISLDELENIIALPPKWYWDYPNSERNLNRVYRIYRKLFSS